ncbi:hypothetical protein AC578_5135 [Pseudocercospora eumusae]|uniref:SRR1-like domain-containing protein n=1 Tax=Pseudocercospora eumusae TaxID=321146 RepID=A0A139HMI7_9PEZI|nr:hypothetical protein AC578_5135 [Pseudocercospora eumusae]
MSDNRKLPTREELLQNLRKRAAVRPQPKKIDFDACYQTARRFWLESDCRRAFQNSLKASRPKDGWSIDRAVLMAIGNISLAYPGFEYRIVMQLILFQDIVETIEADTGTKVDMVVQDPVLNADDTAIFTALGFEVVQRPRGEQLMCPTTFAMFAFWGFEWTVLDKPRPVLPGVMVSLPLAHVALNEKDGKPPGEPSKVELTAGFYQTTPVCSESSCKYHEGVYLFESLRLSVLKGVEDPTLD